MMTEIAVDLMSILNTAMNAYALKEEVEEAVELQLLKAAIRAGLVMGIVMISTTIFTVVTMEEIAVVVLLVGLLMGIVIISITINTAVTMVEIAVDLILIQNIAQGIMNVCVLNKVLSVNTQKMMSCDQRLFLGSKK